MADEHDILDAHEENMDYRKMKQIHELAGYREGLESGKEAHLQQGFNEGFSHGVVISKEWGKLRGTLSALISIASLKSDQDSDQRTVAKMADLLTQVTQMEMVALNPQTMKNILDNKLTQKNTGLQGSEGLVESSDFQNAKVTKHNKIMSDGYFDGNELVSAFQTLHTHNRDRCYEVDKLKQHSTTVTHEKVEGSNTTEADASGHEESLKQGASFALPADLEQLWSWTFSLAEEIGIDCKNILLVKCS